ncbi:SH2 domain-containing protein 1B [Nelusetta ayraudi]|uniref:SH2 domain-containing protein 1B n=1 Tax=Nelusetta ayraudi TaxID=303726 RepID=UPI003F6EF054
MAAALPACYHGAITRRQCELLLGEKKQDGAYLLRDSETIQGALCLCVYKKQVVYTYRLLQTHTGHYTIMTGAGVQEIFFKTLDDLIQHFKKKNQGLATHLHRSVKRKTILLMSPRRRSPPGPPPEQEHQHQHREEEEEHDYENAPGSADYVKVLPS